MEILTDIIEFVKQSDENTFVRFKQLVNNKDYDLNKNYVSSSMLMMTLLVATNGNDIDKNILYYKWANFVADNLSIDYTDLLSTYMEAKTINPFGIAILLKHNADVMTKKNGKTIFDSLKLQKDVFETLFSCDPDDEVLAHAYFSADCNFRMAYHAKEGSIRAIDNLIDEYIKKEKNYVLQQERGTNNLLTAGKDEQE